jgi:hypothetical protein
MALVALRDSHVQGRGAEVLRFHIHRCDLRLPRCVLRVLSVLLCSSLLCSPILCSPILNGFLRAPPILRLLLLCGVVCGGRLT